MRIKTVSGQCISDIDKPEYIDSIEDASCEEIDVMDISYLVSYDNFEGFISKLANKLHKNGVIKVGGKDIIELSKGIMRMDFNFIEGNRLVYGEPSKPILLQLTLHDTSALLQNVGLKIKKKRLNGYDFLVEATKE